MSLTDLDEQTRLYFEQLTRQLGEDNTRQVSMFMVGEALGLDRDASRAAAEDLMAAGLVEVRTLAGDIGLSPEGQALQATQTGGSDGAASMRLGEGSPLDERQRRLVEAALTTIKTEIGAQGLAYQALEEVMADLRTIEAQLASPRAKTAVVRICLTGIRDVAAKQAAGGWKKLLERLLA